MGLSKEELDSLMLRLQKGDEKAFEDIYNETRKGLFAFIFTICRNHETAEDMMQVTYIKLRKTIASYKAGANAYAWLYTIAKNTTLNEITRSKREVATDMEDGNAKYGYYTMEDTDTPIMTMMNKVLGDEERQIVTLHVLSGFKHREIAEMLDKPLGTVLWAYNNALSKLKKAIEKENKNEN